MSPAAFFGIVALFTAIIEANASYKVANNATTTASYISLFFYALSIVFYMMDCYKRVKARFNTMSKCRFIIAFIDDVLKQLTQDFVAMFPLWIRAAWMLYIIVRYPTAFALMTVYHLYLVETMTRYDKMQKIVMPIAKTIFQPVNFIARTIEAIRFSVVTKVTLLATFYVAIPAILFAASYLAIVTYPIVIASLVTMVSFVYVNAGVWRRFVRFVRFMRFLCMSIHVFIVRRINIIYLVFFTYNCLLTILSILTNPLQFGIGILVGTYTPFVMLAIIEIIRLNDAETSVFENEIMME